MRVWVDYNAVMQDGSTSTLIEYIDGSDPEPGDIVTTFDGEGNECPGQIIGLDRDRGLVNVRVALSQFRPA